MFVHYSGFDKDDSTKEIVLTTDYFQFNGDYTIDGRVLILPIQGDGKTNITFTNTVGTIKFTTKNIEKNGSKYWQTDKYKLTFTTTRMYTHFDNLFKGDKALGDNTNLFLNENWEDILKEMKPNMAKSIGKVFETIINSVLNSIPVKDLFAS